MSIEFEGSRAESLDYKFIQIKSAFIAQKPKANISEKESYTVTIKYMSYAVDSDGGVHYKPVDTLIFDEERKGRSGFTGIIRREVTKQIRLKHGLNIAIN